MDRTLIEVDSSYLEETIDHFSGSGDSSYFQNIETMVSKLRAMRTRDERLMPHVPIGNNLAINQMEALLLKVGYSSDS